MDKKEFLYEFLVKYNSLENSKKLENNELSTKLIKAFRNKIVHDYEKTNDIICENYDDLLKLLVSKENGSLVYRDLIIKLYFDKLTDSLGYEVYENDKYTVFQKMISKNLYINLFYYFGGNKFISTSITIYNHISNEKEFFNKHLYIECELGEDNYCIINNYNPDSKINDIPMSITFNFKRMKKAYIDNIKLSYFENEIINEKCFNDLDELIDYVEKNRIEGFGNFQELIKNINLGVKKLKELKNDQFEGLFDSKIF